MKEIKQLPIEVANQIAAGEVVEGPASVVKELVENSVDAGASSVTVTIENSGKSYILVTDDGAGVAQHQLPNMLKRHCTSKLRSISDLDHIGSMGFRGEALASIASVSRIRVRTQVKDEVHAWQLSCEGDSSDALDIIPYNQPMSVGTMIEVRDLFFRVPARQKFLGTDATELRRVKEIMKKMILAHPQVTFSLKTDAKTLLHAAATTSLREQVSRVDVVFGADFSQACFLLDHEAGWGRIYGWCARPYFNRRHADMQVLLVNNRPIRDKKLSFALKRAYHDMMLPGRHAAFCLYLDIDPQLIDVNVHPSKEKVRFSSIDEITRSLKYVVEQALREQMHVNVDPVDLNIRMGGMQSSVKRINNAAHDGISPREAVVSQSVIDTGYARTSVDQSDAHCGNPLPVDPHHFSADVSRAGFAQPGSGYSSQASDQPSLEIADTSIAEAAVAKPPVGTTTGQVEAVSVYSLGFAIGQLHGLYVLAQNTDGLVIIDMHAAHERILYERLKADYADQGVPTQKLLVPYRCHLVDSASDVIDQYHILLSQMGLELSFDSTGTVFLNAIPAALGKQDLDSLVQDVIQELMDYQASDHIQTSLNHIFATMACHSAIRANRVLSLAEMNALLRQIEKTASSDYCNHGRPTWFIWKLGRLDSVFRRGQ